MHFVRAHKVFILVSFLLFSIVSSSQQKITLKAKADKENILIGEQVQLSLEADFPLHEPMRFFTIDSILHFEILERKKIDTIDSNEGIKLSQALTLTSFDSGHWVIPAFELTGDKPLFTDTIPVNVGFSAFDPNQDYHDIKDIINVQAEPKKKQMWYWYVGISVLLVGVMVYLLTNRKKKTTVEKPPVDAYREARRQLQELQKENPPAKLYYTRLVDLFRLYISRRKGIASMQKTTDDLVEQLRRLRLSEDDFNILAQSLHMSDFVKFAKYEPNETDKDNSFAIIKHVIEKIEYMETNRTKD